MRDLYLGVKPKDFDVATSATPEQIRKIFRNSRIIGRRFRLVHVFFGSKVIETSTFRAAPREQAEEGEDLMIRQDNEWGSIEEDARRRDFTVNGLFYDIQVGEIVDFVDGLHDLDARLIRSIGDPAVRFKEDPVRMIRAIKFAARLDFEIEDTAWAALLEVAPDIAKCSRARLLEELYKLLRSGAAKRSFELMLETGILEAIWPDYLTLFERDGGLARYLDAKNATVAAPSELPGAVTALDDGSSPESQKQPVARGTDSVALFWRYLGALDDYVKAVGHAPANGVLQAVLFAPLLAEELQNAPRGGLDHKLEEMMVTPCASLGVARRDRELARQIMMAHRRMVAPGRRGGKVSMAQRQYFHDALVFLGLSVEARDDDGGALAHWQRLADTAKDEPAPKPNRRKKRRRRSGRGRKRSGSGSSKPAPASDS